MNKGVVALDVVAHLGVIALGVVAGKGVVLFSGVNLKPHLSDPLRRRIP